jgi:hypothetical protein
MNEEASSSFHENQKDRNPKKEDKQTEENEENPQTKNTDKKTE